MQLNKLQHLNRKKHLANLFSWEKRFACLYLKNFINIYLQIIY